MTRHKKVLSVMFLQFLGKIACGTISAKFSFHYRG